MGNTIYTATYAASGKIIRAGTAVTASATFIALVLAILSATHREDAFAAVQTHFAEPASFYPVVAVASLLLLVSAFSALAWLFLLQVQAVHEAVRAGSFNSPATAQRFTVMAALIVVIELARYPIASVALSVETAFKGPTSEVAAGAPVAGLIAAIALLATGSAIRESIVTTGQNGEGS